jgi:hypothetical protein
VERLWEALVNKKTILKVVLALEIAVAAPLAAVTYLATHDAPHVSGGVVSFKHERSKVFVPGSYGKWITEADGTVCLFSNEDGGYKGHVKHEKGGWWNTFNSSTMLGSYADQKSAEIYIEKLASGYEHNDKYDKASD